MSHSPNPDSHSPDSLYGSASLQPPHVDAGSGMGLRPSHRIRVKSSPGFLEDLDVMDGDEVGVDVAQRRKVLEDDGDD